MVLRFCVRALCSAAFIYFSVTLACFAADDALHIRTPDGFERDKMLTIVSQYNADGFDCTLQRSGITDRDKIYTVSDKAQSVKVLICYPGCKLVTADIALNDISSTKPFTPAFEKLPTTRLTINLCEDGGKPMAGRTISLRQWLFEAEYFGWYTERTVPGALRINYTPPPQATGVTDAAGTVSLEVPLLLDDPYYAKVSKSPPQFNAEIEDKEYPRTSYDLFSSLIDSQRSYEAPVTIKYARRINGARSSLSDEIDEYYHKLSAPPPVSQKPVYEPNHGSDWPLQVKLPVDFDYANVMLLVGQYGNGLSIGCINGRSGPNIITSRIGEKTTAVKLLVFYPGYKLVTMELKPEDISVSKPVSPKFEKLPTVPLTIKLTNSSGLPIANRKVLLRQSIGEMEYFGYYDGMVFGYNAAPVASGTTNAKGLLTLHVPDLLGDSALASNTRKPEFTVYLDSERYSEGGPSPVPNSILAQKGYPETKVIKAVYGSKITGKISEAFLMKNGLKGAIASVAENGSKICRVFMMASGAGGSGLNADGSFSLYLLPGKYDLSLDIKSENGEYREPIQIKKGYVLKEGKTQSLVIK